MPARSRFREEEATTNSSFRIAGHTIAPPPADGQNTCRLPSLADILPEAPVPEKKDPAAEDNSAEPGMSPEELARLDRRAQQERELQEAQKQLELVRQDIESAKMEAQTIRQQAETDAAAVRDKARMDGYQAGIEEAKEEYEQVLQREKQEFRRSVDTIAKAKHEIAEQLEPAVLDLSLFVAEKIVGKALDQNDELFMNIVRETIHEVEEAQDIVLRLNKKEYDRFFADGNNEVAEALKSAGVEVRQDMSVDSGECVVESEFGTLRSGVKTQLERMRGALESAS